MHSPPAIVVGAELNGFGVARPRRSGVLYRRRGLLSVDQLRTLRAGTRRDMLWRADDPGPGLAALRQAAAAALARPVRRALRSVR